MEIKQEQQTPGNFSKHIREYVYTGLKYKKHIQKHLGITPFQSILMALYHTIIISTPNHHLP